MTHDAGRPPGHGPDRHAIGITRTCLASGTVQLPFALAGALPEGELLVHDAEADEPLVLWSDPPRRLAGLAPFFERHELQVNDSVVLEVRGDELRLATAKRPRRARPAVRPSTWHSLHDERAEPEPASPAAEASGDVGREAGHEVRADPHGWPPDAPSASDAAATDPADPAEHEDVLRDAPPGADVPGPVDAWASPPAPDETEDDHAPRAPRVAVRPLGDAEAGAAAPAGRPVRASDATALRPGPWARLGRLARSVFGGGRAPPSEREQEAARRARERDWTRAWEEDDENDEVAPTPEFVDDGPAPASARTKHPTPLVPDPTNDDPIDDDPLDARAEARNVGHPLAPDPTAPDPTAESAEDVEDGHGDAIEDDRVFSTDGAAPADLPEATPLFPDAVAGARPRRPVDETPSGVPARAERFLGGDLRTRLLRYLESPEMGSIVQADRIAKRFDLDVETATEMLADIADEPPDGLRLRPTREGSWRIERTLRR